MKTKTSKASKIRAAIEAGEATKDIVARLKVPISSVYTMRWKMKNAAPKKRVTITRAEAAVAEKLNVPIEAYAKEKLRLEQPVEMSVYVADLAEIRRQINDLHVIEAFLQIRVDQMRQNSL